MITVGAFVFFSATGKEIEVYYSALNGQQVVLCTLCPHARIHENSRFRLYFEKFMCLGGIGAIFKVFNAKRVFKHPTNACFSQMS